MYRELLGVTRCLQALVEQYKGKFVVLQINDAMNLLGVINRGSHELSLNTLDRELFWFGLQHKIIILVEWVPRKANAFADDTSEWLIPYVFSPSRPFFNMLDNRWGPHTIDIFYINENNLCE